MGHEIKVLVISGSMGSGKTTVLAEASDLLTAADIPHAAVDVDALGVGHLPASTADELQIRNLAAVWRNFVATGVTRLLVSEALDTGAKRAQLQGAIREAAIVVCRLRARVSTMEQRVRVREQGILQERLVARVSELEAELDAAETEDFSVENDGRSITDVAREVLIRAGWLNT
jgi:adenylylsulfate kinase-like enzyme